MILLYGTQKEECENGAVKKVPQQGSQCLPALATKNQEETAAAS